MSFQGCSAHLMTSWHFFTLKIRQYTGMIWWQHSGRHVNSSMNRILTSIDPYTCWINFKQSPKNPLHFNWFSKHRQSKQCVHLNRYEGFKMMRDISATQLTCQLHAALYKWHLSLASPPRCKHVVVKVQVNCPIINDLCIVIWISVMIIYISSSRYREV